jgi:hypothetical protein
MYGGNSPRQKGPRPEHAHPRMSAFTRAGGILHQETRKARRQRLARSLWESGPRPVLEALLEVGGGHSARYSSGTRDHRGPSLIDRISCRDGRMPPRQRKGGSHHEIQTTAVAGGAPPPPAAARLQRDLGRTAPANPSPTSRRGFAEPTSQDRETQI